MIDTSRSASQNWHNDRVRTLVEEFEDAPDADGGDADTGLAALVNFEIAQQSRRADLFETSLFGDPAWNILLELARSHLGGEKHALSDVCSAAGVPFTTGLRHIAKMVDQGLVDRREDGKRVLVSMTDAGLAKLAHSFGTAAR